MDDSDFAEASPYLNPISGSGDFSSKSAVAEAMVGNMVDSVLED